MPSTMAMEKNYFAMAEIASDGDVILVVGAGMKRLKVYSLVLKNSSKVFKAMLGPGFSEGQRLANNESVEINMPEDDAEAMEIILYVLHGCNNAVHDDLDTSQIIRVAITTDKFDCKVALAFAIRVWLNCANITDSNQLWQLLKAAYWFDNAKSFEKISLGLILHHRDSYLHLWDHDHMDADILIRICISLEEKRNSIRRSLLQIVIEDPTWTDQDCYCGWLSKKYLPYIESLRSEELLEKVFTATMSEAMEVIHMLEHPHSEYAELDHNCPYQLDPPQKFEFITNVKKQVAGLASVGLCLNCVRSGSLHEMHS